MKDYHWGIEYESKDKIPLKLLTIYLSFFRGYKLIEPEPPIGNIHRILAGRTFVILQPKDEPPFMNWVARGKVLDLSKSYWE
jgi:hypothetical protein